MCSPDLDDVSQPDNGAHLSTGDCEMTDSESDISGKEEEMDDDPPETPYIPVPEEEFGGVSCSKYNLNLKNYLYILLSNRLLV